jgi:hypothetical protein
MFATLRSLASKIHAWFSLGKPAADEFADELEAHLEFLTDENIRRGMSAQDARRAARIRLGGLTQLKETNRLASGLPFLDTLWQYTRKDVIAIDKDLPVGDIAKMTDVLATNVAQPKFRTELLVLFAAMALILAATGVFGVISYSVSRRTREIGIRMTLGASRNSSSHMVLRETLLLALAGLAVGVPCTFAASRLLGHMLFGITANDPITLIAVAFTLIAVAVVAGFVPLRRATRVDPIVALRYE